MLNHEEILKFYQTRQLSWIKNRGTSASSSFISCCPHYEVIWFHRNSMGKKKKVQTCNWFSVFSDDFSFFCFFLCLTASLTDTCKINMVFIFWVKLELYSLYTWEITTLFFLQLDWVFTSLYCGREEGNDYRYNMSKNCLLTSYFEKIL